MEIAPMPGRNELVRQLPSEQWTQVERLLQAFEEALKRGERPALAEYLARGPAGSLPLLVELVHLDLEYRLKAGEPVRVEAYLDLYPRLADETSVVLDLLQAEHALRARLLAPADAEPKLASLPAGAASVESDRAQPAQVEPDEPSVHPSLAANEVECFDQASTVRPVPGTTAGDRPGLPTVPGYEIKAELGRGGMGVVYQARQVKLNRLVALKMILAGAHAGEGELARFKTEAEAVARLQHPHIVQIHEVGEHNGLPYFSLEFCEGGSLESKLGGAPRPPGEAARLVETLARAMDAAHRAGIVHRDLKPANVLLAGDGTPKITDFGLAKKLDQTDQTASGAIMGTPSYMAPEQASGKSKEVGPPADVYALGAILYEVLTGRPPFKAATAFDTIAQLLQDEPVPPRLLQPQTPRDLETICLKCLYKEPNKRYASALALADDLRRIQAGEPIQARPSRWWERTWKWCRRQPARAALILVSVLAISLMAGGGSWFLVHLQNVNVHLQSALEDGEKARNEEQARAKQAQEYQHQRDLETQERLRQARRDQYLTDIRLAYQYWKNGQVSQGRELLRRQLQPRDGEEDLRGFEWYHLWRQCASRERLTIHAHAAPVTCVAISPDGQTLASGSADGDGTIKLWDSATGQLRATLSGHGDYILGVAFAPDGRTVASASMDKTVRLWDATSGQVRVTLNLKHSRWVRVAFAPDGQTLATGGWGTTIWDVAAAKERATLGGHTHAISSLAYAPDGKTLATGSYDWTVCLWDIAAGKERLRLQHDEGVVAVAFSPDGRTLATASAPAGVIWLWDAATGRLLNRWFGQKGIHHLAFSPDGRTLASGGDDAQVRLWDPATGKVRLLLHGHAGGVHSVAFSPDGKTLASGSVDRTVKVWDVAADAESEAFPIAVRPDGPIAFFPDGKTLAVAGHNRTVHVLGATTLQVQRTLQGPTDRITALACSPDGKTLAAASEDRTVELWDTATGRRQATLTGHDNAALSLAFSPDGKLLATGGKDRLVTLWDLPEGRERITLRGHTGVISCLAFAPDHQTLASGSLDQTVRLWDLASGKERATLSPASPVLAVAYSHDGRKLATSSANANVRLWDADNGRPLSTRWPPFPAADSLAFFPGDHILAGIQTSGHAWLWDVDTQALRHAITSGSGWKKAAFAPDGRTVAIAHRDRTVGLCDLATWHVRTPVAQMPRPVHTLAFSPDGKMLVTGSSCELIEVRSYDHAPFVDKEYIIARSATWSTAETIRFWDPASGKPLTFLQEEKTVAGHPVVAVAPDGRTLATGAADGTVWLWDLATGKKRLCLLAGKRAGELALEADMLTKHNVPISLRLSGAIQGLAFSPDSKFLATAIRDEGSVKLWDTKTGQKLATLLGEYAELAGVAFSPDGKTLVTNHRGQVELWDVTTEGGLIRSPPVLRCKLRGHPSPIHSVAFSHDGTLLVSGDRKGHVKLWDPRSGIERATLMGHTTCVEAVAFARDGATLATGSLDGTVKLWHVASGQELATLEGHTGPVHCLVFSPDGSVLASGGESAQEAGELFFWRAATKESVDRAN
jgi:WD40 repeat protein